MVKRPCDYKNDRNVQLQIRQLFGEDYFSTFGTVHINMEVIYINKYNNKKCYSSSSEIISRQCKKIFFLLSYLHFSVLKYLQLEFQVTSY